jgi:hypothetical protein
MIIDQAGYNNHPQYEIADIFNLYWDEFQEDHDISSNIQKVVHNIQSCRTSELGYHKISCSNHDCSHEEISYNSCRDRHCPKCQGSKQISWVNSRLKELLPVPYFHTIFTMPHTLNNLALFNQRIMYEIFFHATSYTLNKFALDEKFLGGQIGFFGILHTWGQNLGYHVHIHYIVAGCGLMKHQHHVKRLPYQGKFLFPVKAMSKTTRDQFIKRLKKAYYNGELYLPGELKRFSEIDVFEKFCDDLGKESWVCYAKPPFSGPNKVVEYIGRYTHRVAISNNRIQSIDNHQIKFTYKDYKDNYRIKEMKLPVNTFIQRFFYHCLPSGFRKIRHFGFLSGSNHIENLEILISFFEDLCNLNKEIIQSIKDWLERFQGCLDRICPVCKTGTLLFEFSFNSS